MSSKVYDAFNLPLTQEYDDLLVCKLGTAPIRCENGNQARQVKAAINHIENIVDCMEKLILFVDSGLSTKREPYDLAMAKKAIELYKAEQ